MWELALFAVLVQFATVCEAFGINMPTWSQVGMVLAIGFGILLSIEIVKKWLRSRMEAEALSTPAKATS